MQQSFPRRVPLLTVLVLHWLPFLHLALNVSAMPEHYAVAGRKADLPCNVTDPTLDDTVTLVLWYKGDLKVPIYTLDARKGLLEKARHFPGNELGARARFDVVSEPAVLYLEPVHAEDDGIYKCRTEFKRSRTVTEFIRLHVVVPPQEVNIMDEFGRRLKEIIGPYDEGARVVLLCEAEGGIPPPSVTWWRDSVIIDDTFSHTTQGYIRNELLITKLQRSDLMSSYSCQAFNTNLSAPAIATISIDINLKPLDVRITTHQRSLSAGRKFQIECESWGSRPHALLTWWIDNSQIRAGKETVANNLTTGVLNFLPSVEDNGKILSCRAQNPVMSNNVIENGWTLNVHYVPQLKLSLGANIHPKAIREGSDVFFECHVNANPPATEVKWFFEGRPLHSNASEGIIVSNLSLVLQKVKKGHRGHYRCAAYNKEGEGKSEDIVLKVRYMPVCRRPPTTVHGIARYEAVNVTCEVEADPQDVKFRWSLNNTVESIDVQAYDVVNGTTSTVTYTPGTMFGYGVLLCWGTNSIGSQKDPCIIRVIPAGAPESVTGCLVSNQTISSLRVECEPGFDGGLQQRFHLEVYNSAIEHLQANLSAIDAPIFVIEHLQPATSFILVLYSSNSKGKSNSVALMASTSLPPERRTTESKGTQASLEEMTNLSPMLAVLIGVVAVLVSIAIVIVIIMRKLGKYPEKSIHSEDDSSKYDIPLKKDIEDIPDSVVESPDVIPNTTDSQSCTEGKDGLCIDIDTTYGFTKSTDYPYDYRSTIHSQKRQLGEEDSGSYSDFLQKEVPSEQRTSADGALDIADPDFKQRLKMSPRRRTYETVECGIRPDDVLEYTVLSKSPKRSKESLSIPEITTETTPL